MEITMRLSKNLSDNIKQLEEIFPIHKSFDFITRNLCLGKTPAYWIGINGLCNNTILQRLISDLQNASFSNDDVIYDLSQYIAGKLGYIQVETITDSDAIVKNLLSGTSLLLVEGFDIAIILDTRSYPTRGIMEPDEEKVTGGAKDGFVETLVFNTALIRRRIRNPKLTFEIKTMGKDSKTDVAISYVDGLIDPDLLKSLQDKLDSLSFSALTMGSKSLEELLIQKKWYHPLPQIRYTQRPDVACSFLLEGYIILIVDNSPTLMVLPCTVFQFTQHPDDYYQNPSVGNYLRFLRFACILVSLLLLPVFLLLGAHMSNLPEWLQGITLQPIGPIKLFIYVLLIEISLDIFKYSASNGSSGTSNSLGLIGGLIIGDIAIQLNWLSLEVLFYGAATLLASLSISSKEFSDGIRLYRFMLVILTGFFGLTGFIIGLLLTCLSVATTKSFGNKSYLWPLIPFHWSSLKTLLFRYPTAKIQLKKSRPEDSIHNIDSSH